MAQNRACGALLVPLCVVLSLLRQRPFVSAWAFMEPSAQEVADLNLFDLQNLASWAGFKAEEVGKYEALLGFQPGELKGCHLRLLLAMPEAEYAASVSSWLDGASAASMRLRMAASLMRSAAAAIMKATSPPSVVAGPSVADMQLALLSMAASGQHKELRKIKMSNVLDPTDESDVKAATADQLKEWYVNYRGLKFGDPLPDKDPTPDQVSAMHTRVVVLGMEPYADFSVLTPHGRRMAKVLRHRSWLLQEDGTYKPVDVPGPENFAVWEACWKVYEVILLMLRTDDQQGQQMLLVKPIALEAYYENFANLAREHPECWHLCQRAEDRCRAEHFPRVARQLEASLCRPPSWSEVFEYAALDDRFWNREVWRPALAFLARGRAPDSASSVAEASIREKLKGIGNAKGGEAEPRSTKNSRRRARAQQAEPAARSRAPQSGELPAKKQRSEGGGDQSKKDSKGRFLKTRDGQEVCFRFAGGTTADACPTPCPNGRAHVCQKCLQPHRTALHRDA